MIGSKYPEYLNIVKNKKEDKGSDKKKYTNNPKAASSRMTVIASGKGGVGKTWFSISLAQALAQRDKKILLFDGDLGLANVDIQLGILPKHDLGQVLGGRATLQQAITRYEEGKFDIIPGQSGSGKLADLQPQRLLILRKSLEYLSNQYDRVFLDLGAGVDNTVKSLCAFTSHCIVVITDEPTSLTDAYAFIKMIKLNSPDVKIDIVVNQAESYETGQRTYATLRKVCENFLHFNPDLLGIVRRDNLVKDAIRSQSTVISRYPQSSAAFDIKQIASNFL